MIKMTNNRIELLENFQIFLFVLIPLFLITGPFLSDLALSIIALIEIYFVIKLKRFEIFKNFYVKFFLIFWAYIFFNSVIINPNLDSIITSFFYFRYLFFAIAIINLLEQKKGILLKLFYSFLFCFLILIFDGFFQYFNGSNIIGLKLQPGPRASSFFGDELILGSYLSRLLPIFFGITILLFAKQKKIIYLIGLILVLVETLVFISGERTAFFYVNLSALFIIFFIKDYKIYRSIILLLSIIAVLTISNFSPSIKNRMVDTTLDQIGFDNEKKYIFSMEHHDQYMTALNIFKTNIYFGIGIKQFRNNCHKPEYKSGQFGCSSHPHSTYLQFLSELGLVGFFFILYLFLIFSHKLIIHFFQNIRNRKSIFNNLEICLLSSVLITIWPFGPAGNFFNNWLSIVYFMPIPILFWSLRNNKRT